MHDIKEKNIYTIPLIGRVAREREMIGGKTSIETACYLLSSKMNAEAFGEAVRGHWGIENSLHWVLDVTMREDYTRNRKDYGPQNLALLRKLALNIVRSEKSK